MKQAERLYFFIFFGRNRQKVSTFETDKKSLLLLKQTKSLYFCTTVLFPTDSLVLGEHWLSLSWTGRVSR